MSLSLIISLLLIDIIMKIIRLLIITATCLLLSACVHKVVTTPAKIAYKTTKGVVKGGIAVGKAITGKKDKQDKKENDKE